MAACAGNSEPAGPTPTPVAPRDGQLSVTASEWSFEPASIVLPQGEEITITLRNEGEIIHNLKVDDLTVDVHAQNSSGGFEADEDEVLVGADSENVGTITFVALEPGEYSFYCTIANHRQLGMEGMLVVE